MPFGKGYRIEAGIRAARGDLSGALQAMEKSTAASERISGQLAVRSSAADQALFHLEEGNIPAAAACIEQLNLHLDDPIAYHQSELYSIWAYVLLAQEKPEQALVILKKIGLMSKRLARSMCSSAYIFSERWLIKKLVQNPRP